MGRWAAYVIVPEALVPEDTGEWAACRGTVPGWAAYAVRDADPYDPGEPWTGLVGPTISASIVDSGFALIVGRSDGEQRFAWLVNESAAAAYGLAVRVEEPDEATQATERVPVVAAMHAWSVAAGLVPAPPEHIDDLLSRGYTLAEAGLFALFEALGVTGAGEQLVTAEKLRPAFGLEEFVNAMREEAPFDLTDGDAEVLPVTPRVMFLANAIDHTAPGWEHFVVLHELEEWGKPACLVAQSIGEVPQGKLTGWAPWSIHLGTDPAAEVMHAFSPLGASLIPQFGPWRLVPEEYTDVEAAVAWARDNVGVCAAPPDPDRERVFREVPEQRMGIDGERRSPLSRAGHPALGGTIFTYADLNERADVVAGWLERVRATLIEPVADVFGTVATNVVTDPPFGPPYGARLVLRLVSVKANRSYLPGSPEGWERALHRLRAGELHGISCELQRLDGWGGISHHHAGVSVSVNIRDQFTEPTGSLPDDHPATLLVSAGRRELAAAGLSTTAVTDLLRDAAVTCDGVLGQVHGSGSPYSSQQSPYERHMGLVWSGGRLDTLTRGVHWGNMIGPGHLASIGGSARLERLLADGRIRRLDRWSTEPELWWYEITEDPFGAVNRHAVVVAELLPEIMPRPR